MLFALPTEAEVRDIVTGATPSSGGTGLQLEELFNKLEERYAGKEGWLEKVRDVVERKCKIVDNGGDGNFVWLQWKRR